MSAHTTMTSATLPPAAQLKLPDGAFGKARAAAIVAILLGLGLSGFALTQTSEHHPPLQAYGFSWLFAFMFWLSLALGGMFFVLIQHLTRSGWSVVIRRVAEALASTLPLFILFFVPVILSMSHVYPWTNPEVVAKSHALTAKAAYLNDKFFMVRAAFYLIVWTLLSRRLVKLSVSQDYTGDVTLTARLQRISPLGMLAFSLTVTFAAFDWIMSLDPEWYSTIFGVYYFAGCAVGVFSVLCMIAIGLRTLPAFHDIITIEHLHGLGKFLFGFTVFWAYIAFSQFFLIWYANIPEETAFYNHRFHGSWVTASWMLLICNFALQFFILLPREAKRIPAWLFIGAVWSFVFHALDLYWVIIPNRDHEGMHISAGDIGAFLLVGGAFGFAFLRQLRAESVIPVRDPRLDESLAMEN